MVTGSSTWDMLGVCLRGNHTGFYKVILTGRERREVDEGKSKSKRVKLGIGTLTKHQTAPSRTYRYNTLITLKRAYTHKQGKKIIIKHPAINKHVLTRWHLGPLGKNSIKRSGPRVWQIKSTSSNTSCMATCRYVKSSFPLTPRLGKLRWIWEENTYKLSLTHTSLICLWCSQSWIWNLQIWKAFRCDPTPPCPSPLWGSCFCYTISHAGFSCHLTFREFGVSVKTGFTYSFPIIL